ncbi:MAG: hypothetical protein WD739_07515 [Actinomycetota bacterium]
MSEYLGPGDPYPQPCPSCGGPLVVARAWSADDGAFVGVACVAEDELFRVESAS